MGEFALKECSLPEIHRADRGASGERMLPWQEGGLGERCEIEMRSGEFAGSPNR
jgi:hypothetical protein